MEIEWEDPPDLALARVRTPGRYVDFAFALKEHPERWARLPDAETPRTEKGAQNAAQNIRRGTTAGFTPKGAYEAVADEGKVWVRYVPPKEPVAGEETEEDTPPAPRRQRPQYDPSVVRAWARNNGFNVTDRGRIPDEVTEAYGRSQGASVHEFRRDTAE